MTGQISEDGKWVWNGNEWVPRPPPSYEGQEMEVQPKQAITPTPKVVHHITADPAQKFVSPQPVIEHNQPAQQSPIMIVQQANSNKWGAGKIAAFTVIGLVVLVAVTVVLAGVLYVWANSLAEEQDQTELAGTWYNIEDTMTLYANGTAVESTGLMTKWSSEGHNLTTTFLIDDEEIDLVWKYEIKIDTDDDRVLFMAYYDVEDGVQTNEIAENSCIVYIDSVNGANEDYYEEKLAVIPDWCEFVESE
jgi:FlaG/FlaF family flagellin (archaellin)